MKQGSQTKAIFLGAIMALSAAASGAEPAVDPKDLPRIPATEPADVLKTFQIKAGFHLDLLAAEPLVHSPVAMSFDEQGRLFVVEMRDYSEMRDHRMGRIRLLEDTDGDGRFDRSTVYLDNLPWPTAVICYDGGVFVGATPDILYAKDTNGDRVADVRETIFSGFASDYAPYATNKLNVQAMLNSFNWGLDNRIHGAASMSGGHVKNLKQPDAPAVELRGRDFSFDPRALLMRPESGGGQHGMSFDSRGRKFVCSNSSHIQLARYEDRFAARESAYPLPSPTTDIAVDGPAAEVYRISPDEPWRVIRTQWRVSGAVPGMIEGGGRASGYFTGATGVTIYRGDAFPPDFREDAFVADCGSNLVHRKKLLPDGVFLKAQRPADEQKVEFLASRDNWFRPVQLANAPDGCLYVADMYREVIEHPWSLPANIKQFLDLNSGNDRGRIYRITPDGYKQRALPNLGKDSTVELVRTLGHANGWHRDTAARLLFERQDHAAIPALEAFAKESPSPLGRMHALHVLASISSPGEPELLRALSDKDALVRRHAVSLTEMAYARGEVPVKIWQAVVKLAKDADAGVQFQLALSAGGFNHKPGAKAQLLATLAQTQVRDPWMAKAVLNSTGPEAWDLFQHLAGIPSESDVAKEVLNGLMSMTGKLQAKPGRMESIVQFLEQRVKTAPAETLLMAANLGKSSGKGGALFPAASAKTLRAISTERAVKSSDDAQVAAIQFCGLLGFAEVRPTLKNVLHGDAPEAAKNAAIAALGGFGDVEAARDLLAAWDHLAPAVRGSAVDMLLRRQDRARLLLESIAAGAVARGELSAGQLNTLRKAAPGDLVEKTFGPAANSNRQDVTAFYAPALLLPGDAARGRTIYTERCAGCHRAAGQGFALGPDLASVKTSGKATILNNILDPNREVQPKFLAYSVETGDGETVSGIISNESNSSITLRNANGFETQIPKSKITAMKSQGQSLMPEGLEQGLKAQDFADLLEFILSGN